MEIAVDDAVRELIEKDGCDYRVCTACMGPALVKTSVKEPKPTDIQIQVGEHTLYISRYVARYVNQISIDMLYDEYEIDACPAFYYRKR